MDIQATKTIREAVSHGNAPEGMATGIAILDKLIEIGLSEEPNAAVAATITDALLKDRIATVALIAAAVGSLAMAEDRLRDAEGLFEGLDAETRDHLINQVAAARGIDPQEIRDRVK